MFSSYKIDDIDMPTSVQQCDWSPQWDQNSCSLFWKYHTYFFTFVNKGPSCGSEWFFMFMCISIIYMSVYICIVYMCIWQVEHYVYVFLKMKTWTWMSGWFFTIVLYQTHFFSCKRGEIFCLKKMQSLTSETSCEVCPWIVICHSISLVYGEFTIMS